MRNAATRVVLDLVRQDRNVVAVTADNGNEIYGQIKQDYPEQYVDYGIAECNMVAGAADGFSGKDPLFICGDKFYVDASV